MFNLSRPLIKICNICNYGGWKEKLSCPPLPNDRIPQPKNKRHFVADISLPNTPVMHQNNCEESDYQADGQPPGIASFTKGLKHNNRGEVANPADFNSF